MLKELVFIAFALTSSPQPAENYYSWISPEIADVIQECVINDEYREYLDFNSDGELNMADVVGVRKRYQDNCKYGNKITLDSEVIDSIIEENYSEPAIYYEIYRIDGQPCREYEISVNDIRTIDIWIEFENFGETVTVIADPIQERFTVKES